MYSQQHGQRTVGRTGLADDRYTQQQLTAGGVPFHGPSVQPPSATQRALTGLSQGSLSSSRGSGLSTRTIPSQPASSRPMTTEVASKIPSVMPESGQYTITQVHSATEFYGYSAKRAQEIKALQQRIEDEFNAKANDSAFNQVLVIPGDAYVIQRENGYERVFVKSRDSDTKARVKLVDRGDEVVLDTSELLPLNPLYEKLPAFAQPFRMDGFDETKNTPVVTRNLKQSILNKTVEITLIQPTPVNGAYVVQVNVDKQNLNSLPLHSGNFTVPSSPAPAPAAAPMTNRPQPMNQSTMGPVGSQVYTNSARHPMNTTSQPPGFGGPTPQNSNNPLNSNAPRSQPGRFGDQGGQSQSRFGDQGGQQTARFGDQGGQSQSRSGDQGGQQTSRFGEQGGQSQPRFGDQGGQQTSRFGDQGGQSQSRFGDQGGQPTSRFGEQGGQQGPRFSAPTQQNQPSRFSGPGGQQGSRFNAPTQQSPTSRFSEQGGQPPSRYNTPPQQNSQPRWSNDNDSNNSNSGNYGGSSSSNFSRNAPSNQFSRNNDNNSSNNYNQSSTSTEPKRSFGNNESSRDSQNDQSNRTNNFQRSNDNSSNNDNSSGNRNGQGFSANRWNSQSNNNEERGAGGSNFPSSDNFSRPSRGFGGRGHPDQGPDRPSYNRFPSNEQNDNNRQESRGGFTNNRGRRDPPSGGDFGRRYDDNNNRREFQPRGEFSDRGGRGGGRGRGGGGRGGFDNRESGESRRTFDNNESSNGFRNAPQPMKTAAPTVEVGTSFPENVNPKDSFEYVVSHVDKADDFCIQLVTSGTELSSLSETLQREYKECPTLDFTALTMNQVCLALSSDGCWYRAVVISTSGLQPKVRFIDFGDTANVTGQGIRQIAKKHCAKPPYAYRCTLADISVLPEANNEKIIEKCLSKTFQGKIVAQTSDKRFILQSEQIEKILVETNAIKVKKQIQLSRHTCSIVQIEANDHQFFIQDDSATVEKITDLVEKEWEAAANLSVEEVQQLAADTLVMAIYEEVPYRAVIRHEENENDVKVYFVDYGNTDVSAKTSLKRCSDDLNKYSAQAKRCQLFGIPSAKLTEAFAALEEKSDSESIEFSVVNEKDQFFSVLIYIEKKCFNEQFGCDLSTIAESQTPATTDEQQQSPTTVDEKREVPSTTAEVKDELLLTTAEVKEEKEEEATPIVPPTPTPTEETNVESAEEEEVAAATTPSSTRRGLLTHMEKDRAYVYIQSSPDSEEKLEKINEIIGRVTENGKPISDGHAGDLVVARFTDDETYYRARIQAFAAESNSYSVYFVDFGNIDENVSGEFVLSYPDELKEMQPLARGYLLDQVDAERWNKVVQPFLESEKVNGEVEFELIDEQSSIIRLHDLPEGEEQEEEKEEEEVEEEAKEEKREVLSGYISAVDNDCFYFQSASSGVDEMNDVLKTVVRENRTEGQWAVGDRCLVVDDEDRLNRGEIVSVYENDEFTVKCFDSGSRPTNRKGNQLFLFPAEEIFQREPLAHQCRLQSVDDEHQRRTVEGIPSNELVTIEIENERNASCWCVDLRREDRIEEQSDTEKKDEVIASDAVQMEQNSLSVMSNNQTIDFGEHDPSLTTLHDQTQDESVPPTSS